jgi:hypothetical protein
MFLFKSPSALLTAAAVVVLTGVYGPVCHGQEIPQSLTDIAMECPTEVARVTPCIDTSTDVEACTNCFATSVMQTGNLTGIPTDCTDLQDLACTGLSACGAACGLSTTGSTVLTFGSDCDDLFVAMVGCIVQTQGIGTNCTFGETGACPDSGNSNSSSTEGSSAPLAGVGRMAAAALAATAAASLLVVA